MSVRVVVHVHNEEPFLADLEDLPAPNATFIYVTNPRMRDHKPVPWATDRLSAAIFPMARVNFLEVVITSKDEREVVGFFKDNTTGY